MTYLVGQSVLEIKAGAPNNGRGQDNRGEVKQFSVANGRTIYPYVSAQAGRRWLRDSLPAGEQVSPVVRTGEGRKQQAYTNGRPDLYLDDDLFGYMIAVKAESGAKKGESKTFMRDTVLATGTLVAVVPNRPVMDFGTMSRGFDADSHPVIHEHEMYTADLAGDLLLDLPRVGTFEIAGGTGKPALPSAVAETVLAAGGSEVTLRGARCVRLPLAERRRRVAVLLQTMAAVKGGAKQALHYGDRTPALLVLAPLKGGTNPFTRVVREREGATYFDADVLAEEIDAWADELAGPVRVGWAPGFLGTQRERARADLEPLVKDQRVILGHPRAILTALAKEVEDGRHDAWFDDPS